MRNYRYDFIEVDPMLQELKAGTIMQKTMFNTRMSAAHASKQPENGYRSQRQMPKVEKMPSLLDQQSTAAISTESRLAKLPKIPHGTRFYKISDGMGPFSNYANVDLYKIPDHNPAVK